LKVYLSYATIGYPLIGGEHATNSARGAKVVQVHAFIELDLVECFEPTTFNPAKMAG
jgi:hypothetical protein